MILAGPQAMAATKLAAIAHGSGTTAPGTRPMAGTTPKPRPAPRKRRHLLPATAISRELHISLAKSASGASATGSTPGTAMTAGTVRKTATDPGWARMETFALLAAAATGHHIHT